MPQYKTGSTPPHTNTPKKEHNTHTPACTKTTAPEKNLDKEKHTTKDL